MRRSFLNGFWVGYIAIALSTAATGDTIQPVSDEALRLVALQTIFPKMRVFTQRGTKIDHSWPAKPKPGELVFPDALRNENVYRVIGKATNQAEREASEDVTGETLSNTRQVRIRLFLWPNENTSGLLAVLQYDFLDANPALSCPSIGLLVHLVRNAAKWEVRNEYLLETNRHSSLQRVELLDFTGTSADKLLVESDFGGPGTAGSSLHVFDLSRGRFEEVLLTNSRLLYLDQEGYSQVLDIGRTLQSHGLRICFSKTILFENGKWFTSPRIEHPCYTRGDGIDAGQAKYRNRMLAPLSRLGLASQSGHVEIH